MNRIFDENLKNIHMILFELLPFLYPPLLKVLGIMLYPLSKNLCLSVPPSISLSVHQSVRPSVSTSFSLSAG